VTEELTTHPGAAQTACPFVAFEEDRDHRSDAPDYRHRCFASAEPEPRAFPHQERYCLSGGFTACPVFLDWARQEAAAVQAGDGDVPARPGEDESEGAPAFLAARTRSAAPAEPAASVSRRAAEASAGLWNNEGVTRRSMPTAPPPPSSLVVPPVAMARRGPSHPGWENPPRLETFPRLKSRDERHSNGLMMGAVVGVAIVFVALVLVPLLLSHSGGSPTPLPSAGASGSGSGQIAVVTDSPSPTPVAGPTARLYTVGSAKKDPNLTTIAYNNNVSVQMIVQFNAIYYPQFAIANPNIIWEGMQFYIPPPGWTPPPATPTPVATPTPTPTPAAS